MVKRKTSTTSGAGTANPLFHRCRRGDPRTSRPRPSLSRWLAFPGLLSLAIVPPSGVAEITHPIAAPDNCELHPALGIFLYAKEPDVVDPVALTFDEDGRVYVVEMRDYPYGVGPGRKPGGTVRLIEVTDGGSLTAPRKPGLSNGWTACATTAYLTRPVAAATSCSSASRR